MCNNFTHISSKITPLATKYTTTLPIFIQNSASTDTICIYLNEPIVMSLWKTTVISCDFTFGRRFNPSISIITNCRPLHSHPHSVVDVSSAITDHLPFIHSPPAILTLTTGHLPLTKQRINEVVRQQHNEVAKQLINFQYTNFKVRDFHARMHVNSNCTLAKHCACTNARKQ